MGLDENKKSIASGIKLRRDTHMRILAITKNEEYSLSLDRDEDGEQRLGRSRGDVRYLLS